MKSPISLQKAHNGSIGIAKKMDKSIKAMNRSPINVNKLRLAPKNTRSTKWYNKSRELPISLVAATKAAKLSGRVAAAAPLDGVSRYANTDVSKSNDTGAEALKLGVQVSAYGAKGINAVSTAANTTGNAIAKAGKAGAKAIDPVQRSKLIHKIKREFKGFQISVAKTARNTKTISYGILHLNNSSARAALKKTVSQGLKKSFKRNAKKLLSPSAEEVKRRRHNAKLKWYSREQKAPIDLSQKAFTTAAVPLKVVSKPLDVVKGQVHSMSADTNKSGDTGTEGLKLAGQTSGYAEKALSTATSTVKHTNNGIKKSAKGISKVAAPYQRHKLQKSVKRSVKPLKQDLKKVANGTKQAAAQSAKAAKAAANASKQAAKSAANASKQAAKIVAESVAKVASFLTSTSPWSWIIILIIIVVIFIVMMVSSVGMGTIGTLTGGAGWVFDDEEPEKPEEIYENFKEYVEETSTVIKNLVKTPLIGAVEGFCIPQDPDEPDKILRYEDADHNRVYFPAEYGKTSCTNYISEFKLSNEEYAEFLSLLFVLMTREKQQEDGEPDTTIYDFDFKRSDIEELIGKVQSSSVINGVASVPAGPGGNSCKYGPTYLYKATTTRSPVACPGEACEREYRDGCYDAYVDDPDTGERTYFCTGHPYCPINHTEMKVELFTAKEYYQKDIFEIYNMTEAEKTRYAASQAIIQKLLEDYGGAGGD